MTLALGLLAVRAQADEVSVLPPAAPPAETASVAPPARANLEFALDEDGLRRLAFDGHEFLVHPADGALACFARTPLFARVKDGRSGEAVTSRQLDPATATLTHSYPWGSLSAHYAAVGADRLDITITVTNRSADLLERLMLQVARLHYPQVPCVSSVGLDPVPFTGGNFGAANAGQRPPTVLVDYGTAVLLVAGDRHVDDFTAGVFFAEAAGLINRAGIGLTAIQPGESKTGVLSLRFGPPGSTLRSLGGDVLDAYVRANPAALEWPDRRPIGKLFLASGGNGADQLATNPNRWFMNAKDADIRTDAGKEALRERLLTFAAGAIAALKYQNAQGAITWDPEGQRTGQTYYGDPRIIQWIAPEMEYRGTHELATIDAYFKKFAAAGLRHGVCVRPQRVRPAGDYWVQDELKSGAERLAELDAKIGYACKRWGSTLIYIDSDYEVTARDYRDLHARYPNVLLIPEWEQPLHYAYTAPLQSLFHHGVTGTPASIRDLYPKAFIVNMMDNLAQVEEPVRQQVRAAVRAGDVPMVNGWYIHAGTEAVRALYQPPLGSALAAAREKTAVQLAIPDPGQESRKPKGGWCGEAAIQMALLYYGTYLSQREINQAGKPVHADLWSDEVPVAMSKVGLRFARWDGAGVPAFIAWIRTQLDHGYPVLAGAKIYPTEHPEWGLDHFLLVVGCTPDALVLNTTWGKQETKAVADLAVEGTGLSFKAGNAQDAVNYGFAITGMRHGTGNAAGLPVRLTIAKRAGTRVTLRIVIDGLVPGRKYLVLKYTDKDAALHGDAVAAQTESFVAAAASRSTDETIGLDEFRAYQCVPAK